MVFGLLIGGAIFLIVIVVAVTFFSEFFENLYFAFAERAEFEKNRATTRTGSTVCDLRFEIFVSYDEAPFGFDLETKQRAYLGVVSPNSNGQIYHQEVATFLFRDCQTKQSGFNGFLQSIAPTFKTEKLENVQASLLAFTNITPQEFQLNMEFFRVDDGRSIGTKTIRTTEPSLAKLPFRDNQVFIFDNIELNDYNVHIKCSGDCQKINNLPSGESYIYKLRLS